MVGFSDTEDRPAKPEISGHARGKIYGVEWCVWRRSQAMAEFVVTHLVPGHPKPTIRGTGAGLTPYRALLAAAAEALDMGADKAAVVYGLSVALGVSPNEGKRIVPRLTQPRQGRDSKLKREGKRR